MGSNEAAAAISRGIHCISTDNEVVCVPVADGGDGLVEVLAKELEGDIKEAVVSRPLGDKIKVEFSLGCTKRYEH